MHDYIADIADNFSFDNSFGEFCLCRQVGRHQFARAIFAGA